MNRTESPAANNGSCCATLTKTQKLYFRALTGFIHGRLRHIILLNVHLVSEFWSPHN